MMSLISLSGRNQAAGEDGKYPLPPRFDINDIFDITFRGETREPEGWKIPPSP